jgi:2,4-dienoyl-CoA reductase-like NADH-dependent reductase (Old Yellow Enzyme family)
LFKQLKEKKCNYDGVQIHAAHFFFLSRFISPLINHRNNEYGGNIEKRCKILIDIIKGIKQKKLDLHITIKIHSSDFQIIGNDEESCIEMCKILLNEAYFQKCAEKVAENVNVPVSLVGGIRSKKTIQNILDNTKIEIISLSRPLICQPDFPNKMQSGDIEDSACISCNGCYRSKCHRCVIRKKK